MASPFFDADDDTGRITAALCKLMARGVTREVSFAVPAVPDGKAVGVPRLAAPKALWLTPQRYQGEVHIEILPQLDDAENPRRWHAKMLSLVSERYTSLMVGSSNFTSAGMGVGHFRNAEANLLTIVDLEANSREPGQLDSVWPETETVDDPEAAEWLGSQPETEEEEATAMPPVPDGFVSAIYRAGDKRSIHLTLAPDRLPDTWELHACGSNARELLSDASWREQGGASKIEIAWAPLYPPARILVRWASDGARLEAFMPLNVEDSRALPPPSGMENMSADDMLEILAASDPSAAFRTWARRQKSSGDFDPDLDSATPDDLDPLRRYDLQKTFLHRIRRRARVLASLRANLQRPAWSLQALEWRLRGLIGVEALARRFALELFRATEAADEALLTLADFLIVLREVQYEPGDATLSRSSFERVFRPFVAELAGSLDRDIQAQRKRFAADVLQFWGRVVGRCQS